MNTEVILEELEAVKMFNEYKLMLSQTNPIKHYGNDIELHLMAKDCALIAVDKIININVTRDHKMKEYWMDVRDYIELI